MNRDELLACYRDGLLNDTLPFWTQHAVDHQNGGFLTALDRDGTVVDTDKSIWAQGRTTWLFGELYNRVEPREQWLKLARSGAEFLERHGFDPADGRMWFHVSRDGTPIRKRRYSYSECFASIAFGELAQATGEQRYFDLAQSTYQAFIEFALEGNLPTGMTPKFTSHRPSVGLGGPMIALVTTQELRESINLEQADETIDRCIELIADRHVNEELECVLETATPDGQLIDHFNSRTLNPGHAIEGAWFIMSEGHRRRRQDWIALGCKMLDWSWRVGWDGQHGGLLYFVDAKGLPVQEYWHDMKFWWPHNEAIIATLMAYLLTGDDKYRRWHALVHQWSHQYFADQEHGEWFGYLHRDGTVSSRLKGNLWKGPFHLPRMQLECWQWLQTANTILPGAFDSI